MVNTLCGYSMGYHTGIVAGIVTPMVKYAFFNNTLSEKDLSIFSVSFNNNSRVCILQALFLGV